MRKVVLIFCFFLHHFSIYAGGFQLNLQGQKQAGMGHAGTGLLHDASSIFFNPGAGCFLENKFSINASAHFIIPQTWYLENIPGIYSEQMTRNVGTPFALYANWKSKPDSKWSAGIGIYTPFGSKGEWPSPWKGMFIIKEIELKTIFIQPTISARLTEKVSIGAGFIYAIGSFGLQRFLPLQDSLGNFGSLKLDGSGSGIGFNTGVFYKPNEKLSIGVSYRSFVTMKLSKGEASFTVPSYLSEYFPTTSFTSNIQLPSSINLGIGYKLNDKLTFASDINFIGWKSYDSLRIDFANNTDKLPDNASPKLYKNSFIFRIGGQYSLTESLMIRLGSYYDISPVPSDYLGPETPDVNKIGLTTGLSYNIGAKLSIDGSFIYIEGRQRKFNNIDTGFSGTFKSRAFIPGLGARLFF